MHFARRLALLGWLPLAVGGAPGMPPPAPAPVEPSVGEAATPSGREVRAHNRPLENDTHSSYLVNSTAVAPKLVTDSPSALRRRDEKRDGSQ